MSAPISPSDLKRIAERLDAGDELTLEERRAAAAEMLRALTLPRSSYAARDALIVEVWQRFYSARKDRDASNEIAIGLRRYETSAWHRDRSAQECPPRIAGTAHGVYWRMLQLVPKGLSAERIRKIIGQKSADEMTHAMRDQGGDGDLRTAGKGKTR